MAQGLVWSMMGGCLHPYQRGIVGVEKCDILNNVGRFEGELQIILHVALTCHVIENPNYSQPGRNNATQMDFKK